MQVTRNVLPFRHNRPGLGGLAFDPFSAAASIIPAVMGTEGGAGMPGIPDLFGPAAATPNITVSPAIQTTISPQISPVFQQAFQPSGSPMTAGTTQTAPSTQTATQPSGAGTAGGFPDLGLPSAGGGYMPASTYKTVPASGTYSQGAGGVDWQKWGFWLAAGVGVVGLIAVMRKRRSRPSGRTVLPYRG